MISRFAPAASTGEILTFLLDVNRLGNTESEGVRAFERAFAGYLGVDDAVFVPSGRVGLWLILKGFNYPTGSEIILPSFTFYAIPAVVKLAGLKPVYADVDPATYDLTPESVAAVLTPQTKAVLPTHLFGKTCDMTALQRLCEPRGIDLIEDCAQCFGAAVEGKKCGSLGRASYFTFGITKNFTTFGGSMIVARDAGVRDQARATMKEFLPTPVSVLVKQAVTALAMRVATGRLAFNVGVAPILRIAKNDGADPIHRAFDDTNRPVSEEGIRHHSMRPCDAQGRMGLRQLRTLDERNAVRRRLGERLLDLLRNAGVRDLPQGASQGGDHVYMSFAILRANRYAYAAVLRQHGVDVSPGYMADCAGDPGACPNSARVANEILHVPLYPGLSERDLRFIVDAILRADKECGVM
jgi:perosamine synthetase